MMKNLLYPGFWAGRPGLGLLLLRFVFGAAFILHGYGKILHAFNWMGDGAPVPGFMQALAALSEFGGGIGMVLGLLSPLCALGLLGTMTVALLMVHVPGGHPFVSSTSSQPSLELPLIYWAISALLLLTGPGAYSLDAFLFNRGKAKASNNNTNALA